MSRLCQPASQATRSSSRPSEPAGFVSSPCRCPIAAIAGCDGSGMRRKSARMSSKAVGACIQAALSAGAGEAKRMSGPPRQRTRCPACQVMDRLLADLAASLRFYTRLPLPGLAREADPHAMPDFSRSAPLVPIAGALIGLVGALVLALAANLGLAPLPAATIAIGCLVLITGAMHEDGLADLCDGFGGGSTPERKLEIMSDSRLGTYGAAALVLSLLLRIGTLAGLVAVDLRLAAAILFAAGAVSRPAGLLPF